MTRGLKVIILAYTRWLWSFPEKFPLLLIVLSIGLMALVLYAAAHSY